MTTTYQTIQAGEATIRLYADGRCRCLTGGAPGNGDDVAPGERIQIRGRIDVTALSEADRATLAAWDRDQVEYRRLTGG